MLNCADEKLNVYTCTVLLYEQSSIEVTTVADANARCSIIKEMCSRGQ